MNGCNSVTIKDMDRAFFIMVTTRCRNIPRKPAPEPMAGILDAEECNRAIALVGAIRNGRR